MKGKLNASSVGLGLGAFVGLVHAVWALLVAAGYAQGWLNWIFNLHFLDNPYIVDVFDLGRAVTLVVVTFVVGYVAGWVFATVWNYLVGRK